jgi:hypothetical protein
MCSVFSPLFIVLAKLRFKTVIFTQIFIAKWWRKEKKKYCRSKKKMTLIFPPLNITTQTTQVNKFIKQHSRIWANRRNFFKKIGILCFFRAVEPIDESSIPSVLGISYKVLSQRHWKSENCRPTPVFEFKEILGERFKKGSSMDESVLESSGIRSYLESPESGVSSLKNRIRKSWMSTTKYVQKMLDVQ